MNPETFLDVTLRFVPGHGWLYILVRNGTEDARGEFQQDAITALERGLEVAGRMYGEVQP